jgi:hypothetical protein
MKLFYFMIVETSSAEKSGPGSAQFSRPGTATIWKYAVFRKNRQTQGTESIGKPDPEVLKRFCPDRLCLNLKEDDYAKVVNSGIGSPE